jgi:hypothetical protein
MSESPIARRRRLQAEVIMVRPTVFYNKRTGRQQRHGGSTQRYWIKSRDLGFNPETLSPSTVEELIDRTAAIDCYGIERSNLPSSEKARREKIIREIAAKDYRET